MIDIYDNLPFKTAAMYSYTAAKCIKTKWIFPTDRDVVIDFEVITDTGSKM